MRLNPHFPSWYPSDLGQALFLAGRFEEAIATDGRMPVFEYGTSEHVYRASGYTGLDRNEAARKEIARALALSR